MRHGIYELTELVREYNLFAAWREYLSQFEKPTPDPDPATDHKSRVRLLDGRREAWETLIRDRTPVPSTFAYLRKFREGSA